MICFSRKVSSLPRTVRAGGFGCLHLSHKYTLSSVRNVCPQRGQLLKTSSPIRSATRGSWQAGSVLAGRRPNRDSYFPSSVRRGNSTSEGSGERPAVHAINPIRQCCHRQRSVFGPFFGGIDDQHNPPEPTGDRR